MSDEHESVALLPTNNATEPKSPTSVSDFDHERFFLDEKKIDSGTGIVLTEGCKRNEVKYEDLFLIDDKSARLLEPRPAFKFLAKYENYPAGYYSIRWRVKVFQNFQISYGFHFVVNVSYRKEEQDISGSLDVIMAPEILKPQDGDQCYTLVLEEMLVIQPHEGGNDIELELRSIENLKLHGTQNYSGFAVEHVEIRPINPQDQEPSTAASAPLVVTIPRDATPTHIIDIPRDQTLSTRNGTTRNGTTRNGTPPIVPISRLATSRGCRFLATLALSHDMAYITIWDVNSETDASVQYQSVASKEFEHAGIGDLAIGLSLSTRGDQVAIYQEPKIGQWSDGSNVQNGSFNFRVFGNPVAESASAGHTTGYELREVHFQELNTFVGYGKFLEEAENSDWEANDFSTAPLDEDELEDGGTKKNGVTKNDTAMPVDSIFVACNGLTLKVFTTSTSSKDFWSHKHSISLEGLTPTLSRRITCKLMMESISSNTFLWLDDDGLSCTIWNLKTGSNLTYICRSNNARFKDAAFRNNSKMAISPDESMVALASIDGSLTTFSARTGIAIDVRKFPGYKIEHVGFHDRDDHLFVILRDSATFILETRILDAFGLKSDIIVDKVPALTLNTSILAFFYPKGHKRGGMVCEAAYSKINCYISHQPTLRNFTRDPAIAHDKTVHKINVTANGTTVCYQLKVLVHRELVPQGDGATYWVVRVEVHEVNEVAKSSRLIFSFVPEPWVRKRTTDVSNGGDLLMASFIGRDGGFAVIGMQTLQIWNVPTLENPKCSLVFIWSQLKRKIGDVSSEKEKSVCDYYVEIQKPKIYSDDTGGHSMEYLLDGSSPTAVAMPKVFDNRYVFLSCCRSIYLIAAAYAFSRQECTKRKQDSQKVTFTYEDHAEAIACFTLAYINRVISIKNIGNEASASANNVPLATSDHDWHENISTRESRLRAGIRRVFGGVEKPQRKKHTQHEVATLLTLLLDHPRLQESNHIFVEGLLKHADGEWVPRTNRSLNPVRRVIKAKNHQLLESFVDYCTRNAMKYHPAYMVPSMQCLKGLSELYPHILSEMFRKASYIPAHNHDYAAKHAKIANLRFLSYWSYWSYFIPWSADQNTSQGIDDFKDPIFYLRSQLRISDQPHTQFPETQSTPKKTERSHDIYVCPFPGLSSYGRHNSWSEDDNMKTTGSAFTKLAGKKFFGSPAMMATLSFKWKMYGFSIWLVRFTMLLAYFGCVIAITSKQVLTSTTPDAPSQDQITERYLLNWRGFIYATAIFAIVIILYDFKCLKSMKQVVSPYFLMRMLANIFMCVGCFIFVKSNPGTVDSITGTDRGPSQVWPLSFAILAFYLCTLFELRVFKPLGVVVNIILNITRRSMWYFLTFFLFLVGFTHALLHMLHSRKYVFCGNNCTDGEYQDDYPVDFFAALSATYFFLAGRYDPVSNSLDKGTANIHIMMVVFYTFSGVLFMNIIIAVMNDAFDESKRQSHIAWTTQLSKVIANLEYIFIRKGWRNSDFFPDYIYYVVSEKEPGFGAEAASGKQNSAQVTQEELAEIRSLRQNVTQVIQEELAGVRRCLQQNANQVVQEELTETLRSLRQMQEDFARSIQAQKPAAAATSLAQELPSLSSDSQPELDPCSRIPTAQPSGRETEGFTIAPEKASMDANSSEPPGHEIARASTRLQKNNASNPVDVDENGGDGNDGTSDQAQIAPPQRAHTDDREP